MLLAAFRDPIPIVLGRGSFSTGVIIAQSQQRAAKVCLSQKISYVKNKNTKCLIDAHCHRHCRKYLRIIEDYIEFDINSETGFIPS